MKAIAAIMAFVTLGLGVTASDGRAAAARRPADDTRPNIVFILTDDQPSMEMDGNRVMQTVDSVLVSKGMTLTNYFTTIGLCCPSRADPPCAACTAMARTSTAMSGRGVAMTPSAPVRQRPIEHRDVAPRRRIRDSDGRQVPERVRLPGRVHRPAWVGHVVRLDERHHVNFYASVDGVETHFPLPIYQTYELRDRALSFIEGADPTKPLFLYWAPHAPHDPAIPAQEDRKNRMCNGLGLFRPESYDEPDVSDKPPSMQKPLMGEKEMERTDQFRINQCKSLQAVDRSVGDIVTALEQAGRQNTLFIYASDNGMLYGEHRITMHKNNGYDEAIHVPFIARREWRSRPGRPTITSR